MPGLLERLDRGLGRNARSGGLGILSSYLLAAGAPTTDPGQSQRLLAEGLRAYSQNRRDYQKEQEDKAFRELEKEHLQAKTEKLRNPTLKAPTTRNRIEGDRTIVEQWNPATGKYEKVSEGPRYKPETNITIGGQYKPLAASAKLYRDREYLTKPVAEGGAGLPENHPNVQAIDRQIAKEGRLSGEATRIQEMIKTGSQTMQGIIGALMPDGENVDMGAVTSMWASIPKTAGRTTSARMEEAASLILRLETGAQANESEIRNTAKRYQPSPLDSPATAKDKLMRLQRRFENARSIAEGRDAEKKTEDGWTVLPNGVRIRVKK